MKTIDEAKDSTLSKLFRETINPSDPTVRSLVWYRKDCNKLPLLATVLIFVKHEDLVIREECEDDLLDVRYRDVVIIAPSQKHSVPKEVPRSDRVSYVISCK